MNPGEWGDIRIQASKWTTTDLLDRNAIEFRAEPFGEGSEGRVFFVFVEIANMKTAARLIAEHAEKDGYKVTVHFGDDTPSRWINHDEDDAMWE